MARAEPNFVVPAVYSPALPTILVAFLAVLNPLAYNLPNWIILDAVSIGIFINKSALPIFNLSSFNFPIA